MPLKTEELAKREALFFKLAILALLLVPVILFSPSLFGEKMLWGADIETLEFPFNLSARRNLAMGEWPLWMPELFGGMPGIAATNIVFLYPSELLIHLLRISVTQGFALDAALQVALSGWGMLFFCRRLGASLQASFLAAIAFALSGSQISILFAGHINNIKAIAMIPWAFWATHKALTERSFFAWGLCGLALALQMLGIGMQIFAYTAIGLALFIAWWASKAETLPASVIKGNPWIFGALGLAMAMFLMFLVSAPQLWLSLQYKPYSWREGFSYDSFISWSFHPKESLGWIVPGFYGWRQPTYHGDWPFCLSSEYFGLLPWALSAAALAALWKVRHGWVRFLAGFAVLSFLIALGKWTPIHQIFYRLPVYSGFRTWARFLSLFTFSICALSALGWDALFSGLNQKKAIQGALAFCALAFVLALICLGVSNSVASSAAPDLASALGGLDQAKAQTLEMIQSSAGKAAGLALALAAFLWFTPRRKMIGIAFVLALGLQLWDISEMASRYVVYRDPADYFVRPPELNSLPDPEASLEPYRVLDAPGVWRQNQGIFYGYENLLGYHGIEMATPIKTQKAMEKRQLPWLDMMNVRYILSRQALAGFPLLSDGSVKVYSNPGALSRAWLVRSVMPALNDDDQYRLLGSPAFLPANDVILSKPMDLGITKAGSPGLVRWVQRKRNSFDLEVSAVQDSVLVISQTWYPAWVCEMDGHPVEIMKADGGIQAVAVSAGNHRLHFYYSGALLGWASLASLLGLSLLAGLGLARRRGAAWA
jgi:hypothetical protein